MRRLVSIGLGILVFVGCVWAGGSYLLIPAEFFEVPTLLNGTKRGISPASFQALAPLVVTPTGRIDPEAMFRHRERIERLWESVGRLDCRDEAEGPAHIACEINRANLRLIAHEKTFNMPETLRNILEYMWEKGTFFVYRTFTLPRLGLRLAQRENDWRLLAAFPDGREVSALPFPVTPQNLESALKQGTYRFISQQTVVRSRFAAVFSPCLSVSSCSTPAIFL